MQIEISSRGFFKTVNQFKFIKDIGVGSFGKVKLAMHRGTRKNYAIKIIDLANNLSQTQIQIVLRQIKMHMKLDHPHIIKLWDTILDDNKIYMVMDYAKNGSLFRYHSTILQTGNQPTSAQLYQFFYQSLQAIKYMHNNDLMHRDIKPQNLLLDEDYNIKLCDFGWATNQIYSSRTTFCGTYEYMAPQMVMESSYDYRIDIWALGVLLFELVHGRAPFQAENLKIMKQKINKGSYEIDSGCESNLKDLIVEILQFEPEKRLSIQEIQKNSWVKMNISMNQQDINSSNQMKLLKSGPHGKVQKHHHQKSLGNFQTQAYKNYFNDTTQDQGKHKLNIFDLETNAKPQAKKHKRNITQPDAIENIDPHTTELNSSKKAQIPTYLAETDSSTPNVLDTCYLLANQTKSKLKCKTQADMSKLDMQNPTSKRNIGEMEDFIALKKRKINMLTQTGQPVGFSHIRNFSGQIAHQGKQNEPYLVQGEQKLKKKLQAQSQKFNDKPSSRTKKPQQKFIDLASKFTQKKPIYS